jgi:hypothetical protein
MAATASSAHAIMTDASLKVSETTRDTVSAVKRSGPVQNYVMPAWNFIRQKYQNAGPLVKITLMTFGALSAIPLTCFFGFMSVVTVGCLIVAGIAFTIVEVC